MIKLLKNWQKYFPLIGIFLFIFILSRINFRQFLLVFRQIRYCFLFLLPLTISLIFLIQTLKWQKLLKIQKFNYKFRYLLKVHIVSFFYAILTPSHLGYFVKVGYLNDAPAQVSASVIVDRILDVLALMIFAATGAFLLIGRFPNLLFCLLSFVFVFLAVVLFFYSKKRAKFFFSFLKRFIPSKFQDSLKRVFHVFYDSLPQRRKLLAPFLLTILTWFLVYTQGYIIAMSLNLPIDFWHYIFYFPIATAIGLIPITISGLGTREATLILLFSQFSISVEAIIALSITAMVLTAYLPALYGVFLSFRLKKIRDYE